MCLSVEKEPKAMATRLLTRNLRKLVQFGWEIVEICKKLERKILFGANLLQSGSKNAENLEKSFSGCRTKFEKEIKQESLHCVLKLRQSLKKRH